MIDEARSEVPLPYALLSPHPHGSLGTCAECEESDEDEDDIDYSPDDFDYDYDDDDDGVPARPRSRTTDCDDDYEDSFPPKEEPITPPSRTESAPPQKASSHTEEPAKPTIHKLPAKPKSPGQHNNRVFPVLTAHL